MTNQDLLKPVFEIKDDINPASCELLCEISDEGFTYLVKDEEKNMVVAFAVYHFNTHMHGSFSSIFQKIFEEQEVLNENFKKIFLIYSLPESVLIPFSLYNSKKNGEIMNLIHGDLSANRVILTDMLMEQKVYNSYRVPIELITEIRNKFPVAEAFHQYSVLMKNSSPGRNKLSVIFYPKKIVVVLEHGGKLQLMNSYSYNTPEDVSYHLLNACRQFEIDNIPVEVAGLIERDSELYKEIYKYFESVSFHKSPKGISLSEKIDTYPPHYFSHFFAVETCE